MKAIHQDHMHLFDGDIDESLLVYSCKSCEYKFVNEQILRNHQKYRHKEAPETGTFCKLCDIGFKFPSLFKKHKEVIHKEDLWAFEVDLDDSMLRYECPHCSLKFITENLLKYHTTLKHKEESKQNDSYCKLCYHDFKFNSQLNAHKKSFTRQEEKGKHSLLVESSASPHKCKYCKTNCNAILSRKSCDGSK